MANHKRSSAISPQQQENKMIALATDLAEQQLAEGTASTAVITHYLRLGSERERLERERLQSENELLKAKIDSAKSAEVTKALYEQAIEAMRRYSGG